MVRPHNGSQTEKSEISTDPDFLQKESVKRLAYL